MSGVIAQLPGYAPVQNPFAKLSAKEKQTALRDLMPT
tara:strand:+ start:1997 stop:2107 length:111 start_codon:yes stop_codon:yes gene_type:complete